MNECISEEEKQKREDRERKKAEVRARLEAASHASKKKGFMTPERKKKLRLLLRKKAAEELKRQQEAKAAERRQIISQRTGSKKSIDGLSDEAIAALCRQYYEKIIKLEGEKYDLEYAVGRKDFEIGELASKVNDMRGKFIKPPLKKIPKFEAKIERMLLNVRKEIGFTVALKSIKKDQLADPKMPDKSTPEWSWKSKQQSVAQADAE